MKENSSEGFHTVTLLATAYWAKLKSKESSCLNRMDMTKNYCFQNCCKIQHICHPRLSHLFQSRTQYDSNITQDSRQNAAIPETPTYSIHLYYCITSMNRNKFFCTCFRSCCKVFRILTFMYWHTVLHNWKCWDITVE